MKWRELDARAKRKTLILAGFVAAGLLALMWPSGVTTVRPKPRPSPFAAAARANGGGAPAHPPVQAPAPPKDAAMLGRWEGTGAELANHRVCRLWLEIGKNAVEPGKFTGAATLSCTPALSLTAPNPGTAQAMLLARMNPLVATMSGAIKKDAMAFEMDKQLNAGDCAWTGFSVAKFGSQNLSAEIQDVCGGGSVLLRRSN